MIINYKDIISDHIIDGQLDGGTTLDQVNDTIKLIQWAINDPNNKKYNYLPTLAQLKEHQAHLLSHIKGDDKKE